MGGICKVMIMSGSLLILGVVSPAIGNTSSSQEQQTLIQTVEHKEQVITEPTKSNLPGNRLVTGRIISIRGNQMEIDIGISPAAINSCIAPPEIICI